MNTDFEKLTKLQETNFSNKKPNQLSLKIS